MTLATAGFGGGPAPEGEAVSDRILRDRIHGGSAQQPEATAQRPTTTEAADERCTAANCPERALCFDEAEAPGHPDTEASRGPQRGATERLPGPKTGSHPSAAVAEATASAPCRHGAHTITPDRGREPPGLRKNRQRRLTTEAARRTETPSCHNRAPRGWPPHRRITLPRGTGTRRSPDPETEHRASSGPQGPDFEWGREGWSGTKAPGATARPFECLLRRTPKGAAAHGKCATEQAPPKAWMSSNA